MLTRLVCALVFWGTVLACGCTPPKPKLARPRAASASPVWDLVTGDEPNRHGACGVAADMVAMEVDCEGFACVPAHQLADAWRERCFAFATNTERASLRTAVGDFVAEMEDRGRGKAPCAARLRVLLAARPCQGKCKRLHELVRKVDDGCTGAIHGPIGERLLARLRVKLEPHELCRHLPGSTRCAEVEVDRVIHPEEVSHQQSQYQRGVIAADQVETELHVTIDAVDRSQFPKRVRARVYVRDENGNLVGNLAPPYGLAENVKKIWRRAQERIDGRECGDGSFTVVEYREDHGPARGVAFVPDYSGSMVSTIGDVEQGLRDAVEELRDKGGGRDRYGLVKFDHRVRASVIS